MPHDHHDHEHDHSHGHAHAPPQPDDKVHSYYQMLGVALKELLVEKGVVSADEVRAAIEKRDQTTPAHGAKVVAKSWVDPLFRIKLLMNANQAVAELGFPMTTTQLVAVENDATVHHVVVCTLCSCYPRELLGLPPAWYKSRAYRARSVSEPRAVLAGEVGPGPLDHDAEAVHEGRQLGDVDEDPQEPGQEAAEPDLSPV